MTPDTTPTALPPMTARELLHYDAAMAIAEERIPSLFDGDDAAERRLRARLRMAYHAAILAGWTDLEHRRRMVEITASLGRTYTTVPADDDTLDPYEAAVLQGLGL